MAKIGFVLKSMSEKGEAVLRRLYRDELKTDRKSKCKITGRSPFTVKVEILDFRVKLSVKAGAIDLALAAQQQLAIFDSQILRGVDYEVKSFNH